MRDVFECVMCRTHYLPPQTGRYADGTPVSPLHCSAPACAAAMAGRATWHGMPMATAERHARQAAALATRAAAARARSGRSTPPGPGRSRARQR